MTTLNDITVRALKMHKADGMRYIAKALKEEQGRAHTLYCNYAKQGDLILDTHVGSASSLIACYDMGFDAVGFELDKDYYEASKKRLEEFMAQGRLFDD